MTVTSNFQEISFDLPRIAASVGTMDFLLPSFILPVLSEQSEFSWGDQIAQESGSNLNKCAEIGK
jgi:hypothetical protein